MMIKKSNVETSKKRKKIIISEDLFSSDSLYIYKMQKIALK